MYQNSTDILHNSALRFQFGKKLVLLGKIPEDLCLETLSQLRTEEAELTEKTESLTAILEQDSKAKDDVEEFICRLKQYADAPELTREMCVNLIEYIIVGDRPKDKSIPRNIQIYYKFLDNGLVGRKAKIEVSIS